MLRDVPGDNDSCHLLTLPAEIRTQVLDELQQVDHRATSLRALSQTCKSLLSLLQHELYHTLTLCADARSGRSLQRITAGPRALLVKRLVFRARDPRPAWERQHDPRYRLSVPSKQVLTFLHRFPNLREFELDVDCKLDLWFSEHPEPRLYPIRGHSETYRFILDETLRALGRSVHHNQARALPKLIVRGLPPRVYRALVDHGLHLLLNDLQSFHIELPDETRQPPPPSYCNFVSRLDTYFLGHLNNVRDLHLQATTLVGEGEGVPNIDFAAIRLPCLRKLKLSHFILGQQFDNFLSRHLGTLYSIILHNCYKDQNWSTLFRKVKRRKPSKLTRFDVSEPSGPGHRSVDDAQAQLDLCEPLRDGRRFPRVRVFCGHVWTSHEDEMEELKGGQSLVAWRQLQLVVDANKKCWERFKRSQLI